MAASIGGLCDLDSVRILVDEGLERLDFLLNSIVVLILRYKIIPVSENINYCMKFGKLTSVIFIARES